MSGVGRDVSGGERRVFRSPFPVAFAVIWSAFVVANLVDLALRGTGRGPVVLAAGLLLATAVVAVTCVRPGIVADESGVTVHNPLRDVRAPWAAIERIDATDAVRLHTRERRYRCWAMQSSHRSRTRARLREQARAAKVGAQVPGPDVQRDAGRSRSDEVAAALEAMADRFRAGEASGSGAEPDARSASPPVVVTWSRSALAGLGGTVVLVIASVSVPLG